MAELEFGFEGTDYGMRQMLWTGKMLSTPGWFYWEPQLAAPVRIEPWIRNSLIESFLNNARRLAWFLKGADHNDAYAGDYLPSWPERSEVGRIIGQVSVALSHARYKGKPGPYKFRSIAGPIANGMLDFTFSLEAIGSTWHERFQPLEGLIETVLPDIRDLA